MSFSTNDVQKIAHLARLSIPKAEIELVKRDLGNILHLVKKMNIQDTDRVEPIAHPFDATQPFRPDAISETNQRDAMQSTAPEVKSGLYIVPQFVEVE